MKEIQVNKIYKHFKGKFIIVICIGLEAETKKCSHREIRRIMRVSKGTNMV